jgi:iron complex transport system ATP-binding protein
LATVEKLVEKGHNIIFVTHHIEEVIPAINNVLFLKDGRIVDSGNKEEMLKTKNLNKILDYKFKIKRKYGRYWLSL